VATDVTHTDYDAAGRAVASTDALGKTTRTTYDGDGRAIRVDLPNGSFTQTHYDSNGRKDYDIDAVGQRTDYGYDSLGRLQTVTQPAVIDPATGQSVRPVTTYGYDNYGNRTSITDANQHVTAFAFDAFGRQTGRTLPAVNGTSVAENQTYDSFGNAATSTDFAGNTTVYIYDYNRTGSTTLGRLMETDYYAAGAGTPEETETYSYDSLGRRESVIDTVGGAARETDYQFDLDGHVTQVTSPEGTIYYQYDLVTGLQTRMNTDQTEVDYAYDPLGRLVQVQEVKRAGTVLSNAVVTAYGYDAVGDLTTQVTTQGSATLASTTDVYDEQMHWLKSVVNAGGFGSTLSSFTYTRRADGQITQVVETVNPSAASAPVHTTTVYSYDALDRLTEEAVTTDDSSAGSYTTDYTLDLVGNRVKEVKTQSGQTTETDSSYNARDELAQETVLQDGVQSSQTQFDYDDNGSLTNQSSDNGDSTAYRYDARGRLSGATVVRGGATTETSYVYTADGIRAAETVNGVSTRYIIDGFGPSGYAQVVEEWSDGASGSPILLASYVFGAGLVPVSQTNVAHDANGQVTGTQTGLFLADGHSGVRQVIDVATDGVILVNRYDAFGGIVSTAGSFATPIGYRGQWFDAVLGQYVMRARLYDPASGRFTAMDRWAGTVESPLTLKKYLYGNVNPVYYDDPSGFESAGESMGTISVGATLASIGGALFPKLPALVASLFWGLPDAVAYGIFAAGTSGPGPTHAGPIVGVEFVFDPHEHTMEIVLWGGIESTWPNGVPIAMGANAPGQLLSKLAWLASQNLHTEVGAFEAWEWHSPGHQPGGARVSGFMMLGMSYGNVFAGAEADTEGNRILLSGFTKDIGHGGGHEGGQLYGIVGGNVSLGKTTMPKELMIGTLGAFGAGFGAVFAQRGLPAALSRRWAIGIGAIANGVLAGLWVNEKW
jgi:RHS repeat-associated protein